MHLICDRIEDGIATMVLASDNRIKFTLPHKVIPHVHSGDHIDAEFRVDRAATEQAQGEAGHLLDKLKGVDF